MLTTTLDGLWVLQVLAGIEDLAPELCLRPHLPSVESAGLAMAHPVAAELRSAGAIGPGGAVDQTVIEWLTVLSRRDVGLLLHVQTPAAAARRVLLARYAQWWTCMERSEDLVRISPVGTASDGLSAGRLIHSLVDRICGEMAPATVKPVTLEVDGLLAAACDAASLRSFLVGKRFEHDQVATLMLAADAERSAQASLVALQPVAASGSARSHVEAAAVTIIDTPQGRLLSECVPDAGTSWLIVSPGSGTAISNAVQTLMRRLPARDDWHSHRRAV